MAMKEGNPQSIQELLTYHIYPALFQRLDQVFAEFAFKRKAHYWQSTNHTKIDGSTGDSQGKVYVYAKSPYGILDYTRGFITIWDYIQRRENLNNTQTLSRLADLAGVALPGFQGEQLERYQAQRRTSALWEDVLAYCRNALFDSQTAPAEAVRQYLYQQRGYDAEQVRTMELGFLLDPQALYTHLTEVKQLDYAWFRPELGLDKDKRIGSSHVITIPFRGPAGYIQGMAFRTIDPNIQPKYINSSGTHKGLFNLHVVRQKDEDAILVEGQLDALHATACGIPNVVALGGASLRSEHLTDLVKAGIKGIVLCLDGDTAGQLATLRAIETYIQDNQTQPSSRPALRCYVAQLPTDTDPDSLIRTQGQSAFERCLRQAKRYFEYWLIQAIAPIDVLESARKVDATIVELAQFAVQLPEWERIAFLQAINQHSQHPELTAEAVERHMAEAVRTLKAQAQRQALQQALFQAQQAAQSGEASTVITELQSSLTQLQHQHALTVITPYTPEEFLAEIQQTAEGMRTGITALDDIIRIPQGAITLIAGRTGHGKTTMMLNLMYSMASLHRQQAFYFITYEEERKYICLKMLNLMTNLHLDPINNRTFLLRYLQQGQKNIVQLEHSKHLLFDWMRNQRLQILDGGFKVEELCPAIAYLQHNSPLPVGAVFIDYIQKIGTSAKIDHRQQQLQAVSNKLLQEVAKGLSLPVILGAQLNRETDRSADGRPKLYQLREAGDLEQDANLVLGIYNPAARDEFDPLIVQDKGMMHQEARPWIDFEVKALKNRDGAVNSATLLRLFPQTGRLLSPKPPNGEPEDITLLAGDNPIFN
jgi:DNA primase catalytic core